MTKTAEQIAREQAIAKQNANTQQGLMQLKQKEALKSDNFLAPENKTEGGLEGPTLSREFGTSVGGSAYLMPTDYGTEPEMDRIWEQPVTLPDIDEPEDIDLELIKPLEELEQVPYLTEEYGNKVRQLNDLAVAARSAGFNIKKPDAHDPRQMKAYTLYQQILGESTALGGSLQEGYKAQELVAKDPAKYAKLLYNKEAGITRATRYSDLVGSDIDKGVVEFNKGLEAWERTTDKDDESFKIKEQEYNTMYNDLAVRLDALTKAGRLDEAMRVKVSMDALRKPVQTYNMDEYEAQTKRAASTPKPKFDITTNEKIIKTDIVSKVAGVISNPTMYTEKNGVLSTGMLNGYKYNGQNIKRIEIGDPSHTKGLWNLTPEDARHYYTLKQKQRNLTALLKLSPEQMVKYRQDEEGFKKYVQDFNKKYDTDIPNDYDELFDENGKLLANTLTEKELASIKRFEEDRGYGITIYTEGDVDEETGEKTENNYYLEPNETNSLLDNIVQNSDVINEDQKSKIIDEYKLVDQNNKLDGDLIDNSPVMVDFDFNGDGVTEKVPMGNQEQRAFMKANYLLRQGEYSMIEDAFVSFLDDDSNPEMFTAPAARYENSVIGGLWQEYFVNNKNGKAFRFNTEENSLFGTVKGIEIVPDVGLFSNPFGERRFKIQVVNSDGNDYLPQNIWNKLNIEGKERDDAFTVQEMQEFIKNTKVIANDPNIKKHFQRKEEIIGIFRKKRAETAQTQHEIKDTSKSRRYISGQETSFNPQTGEKNVIQGQEDATDW